MHLHVGDVAEDTGARVTDIEVLALFKPMKTPI